ncbi:MAG: hypothetical protein DWB42_13325 [Chloroflexi bacterium]|nr:hypothetical protein [Chloroflexota bacterium]
MSQPLSKLMGITCANQWDQFRINLNSHEFERNLLIHITTQKADPSGTCHSIIGCASVGTSCIGGRACQPNEAAVFAFAVKNQPFEQIILLATRITI